MKDHRKERAEARKKAEKLVSQKAEQNTMHTLQKKTEIFIKVLLSGHQM